MKKLLISIVCFVSVIVTGCSGWLPGIYKIDIQQGNVVTQEKLNRVQPGMTRNQVRYLLGTPLVRDPFHRRRWDYVYRLQPGHGKPTETRVTAFFDQDRLVRIEGSMHPEKQSAGARKDREPATEVVTIEPKPREKKGFFGRLLEKIGIGGD